LPQLAIDDKASCGQYRVMAQHWTSRMTRKAREMGRVFRTQAPTRGSFDADADARRMRIELDAIRARFPDHA
jgi:hypothetical protein